MVFFRVSFVQSRFIPRFLCLTALMFSFSPNDFLACNGTRIGAEHLHGRMQSLRELIEPALIERHPDLAAVVSPIYATVRARPNPNRPRDHACLYFVDRALKKSRFPRLPQLGVYLHHSSLAIGFYSGWWTSDAMRVAIADREKFRGLVPRKGYRCFAGDIIVESPGRSVLWSPSKLAGVDRSLFVGRILTPEEAARPCLVDAVQAAFADLYALYAVFAEARAQTAQPRVAYVPDPAEEGVVKDALAPAEAELLCDLHRFIALKNFHIEPGMLFNLYLCLKTKPFLILAGISGTGKSTVIRLIAEAVNGLDKGRAKGYRLIPVRPDWNDVRDLLGFENLLTGAFRPGALLQAMREAQADPGRPYFACLDEMNLARVEHYFADFLSIMETARRTPDGAWTTDPIELARGRDSMPADDLGDIPRQLPIPPNFFVAGTVNMDETTYAFSPKVLDRANTVAFDRIDLALSDVDPDAQIDSTALRALGSALIDRPYRQLEDIRQRNEVIAWNQPLEELNAVLAEEDLHFGYRVRDEILIYMAYALDLIDGLPSHAPAFAVNDAFDYQILQKILPRLSGAGDELAELLDRLIAFCDPAYPRTTQKLQRVKRRLDRTGFVSFW